MSEDEPILVWMREPRAPRRQGPDIDRIVTAAIAIADADGLEAVSMRRVAADLGSGTASLYRSLAGRDDLIDLMIDRVRGERDLPERTGHWRADLTALAHHLRATLLRHPWLGPQIAGRPALGPNSLLEQEFALAAAAELTPDIARVTYIVDAVGAYIFGATTRQLAEQRAHRHTGLTEDQWRHAVAPYIRTILAAGEHPHLSRRIHQDTDPTPEDTFTFGLTALLDGIAHAGRYEP
ncbi:TetR/AcrR family transcriptional regulator [Nocardia jiangxiensis]|uniref:TetR/AcrR family transcriptional regulator n=1 Tax=Nocardia jiangxiensis TaxID=282685 RepID=A0ABW6S9V5_9NOCA|nr:TetR/AcrR family transcriptional regulator C-terminal domain-containing protein [Nocardia jiangxiensis]